MVYEQGDVWWGPAPHKSGPSYRPWVIVSDDGHPFSHTECIALAMTTQQHAGGIPVPDDAWIQGGAQTDSYISPWYTTTIKHRDLDNQQGTISLSLVTEAVDELHRYTPAPEG
ncbi:type II toxin-antitoxin system PemK/MazF family toxin [Haloarcula halophila]|uniref:type II toxin-antitoxin system PemK/MazF family toxin n=1 Tax=Halomicroarcula sp. GCM10025335 TaxID=3252668 RepID=UPI003610F880